MAKETLSFPRREIEFSIDEIYNRGSCASENDFVGAIIRFLFKRLELGEDDIPNVISYSSALDGSIKVKYQILKNG